MVEFYATIRFILPIPTNRGDHAKRTMLPALFGPTNRYHGPGPDQNHQGVSMCGAVTAGKGTPTRPNPPGGLAPRAGGSPLTSTRPYQSTVLAPCRSNYTLPIITGRGVKYTHNDIKHHTVPTDSGGPGMGLVPAESIQKITTAYHDTPGEQDANIVD